MINNVAFRIPKGSFNTFEGWGSIRAIVAKQGVNKSTVLLAKRKTGFTERRRKLTSFSSSTFALVYKLYLYHVIGIQKTNTQTSLYLHGYKLKTSSTCNSEFMFSDHDCIIPLASPYYYRFHSVSRNDRIISIKYLVESMACIH